jgi:hypothetical protein
MPGINVNDNHLLFQGFRLVVALGYWDDPAT